MGNYLRRRGVTLTTKGSRKLHQAKAKVEIEQNFQRYTLEVLSEETGLTPTTLSKVFTCSVGVDKRTLERCFDAFNLTLANEDYHFLKTDRDNFAEIGSMSAAEICCSIEPACNCSLETLCEHSNRSQIHHRDRSPDNLPPRLLNIPGGLMPLDSVFYIDRPILESLCYEAIQQPGALLNICAPKQMGKTSLMMRILAYASSRGYYSSSVSLQLADVEILKNLDHLLQWFCGRVSKRLDLSHESANFWANDLGSKANATDYFEDILLANLDRPLVIAIDELNQLFTYSGIAREFLLLLRTWSEQAKARIADRNPWHKLRLVTVHSTEILMHHLIDPSLMNTGLTFKLTEFTPGQVQDLAERCGQEINEHQIEQLITLLGGHPYRLQLAFYYLQKQTINLEELLSNSALTTTLYAEHLEQQWSNLQRYPELLKVLTQILWQSSPVECKTDQGFQLQQMGLIHLQGFQASLACELFRPFFCDRLPPIK